MQDGKRRKLEVIAKKDDSGDMTEKDIIIAYVETVFYECAISAQYTANLQILFNIEDITRRMFSSDTVFSQHLLSSKKKGSALISNTVEHWLKTQSGATMALFKKNNIKKATMLSVQRKGLTVTIDAQAINFTNESNEYSEIASAINLLRYPIIMMEKIQRLRTGTLFDIEKDAPDIILLANDFSKLSHELLADIQILNKHTTAKKLLE